jgi:hypothetical protein
VKSGFRKDEKLIWLCVSRNKAITNQTRFLRQDSSIPPLPESQGFLSTEFLKEYRIILIVIYLPGEEIR